MFTVLLTLAIQQPAVENEQWIALTKSGLRIECKSKPSPGALSIQTAYGIFNTPTSPVVQSYRAHTVSWKDDIASNNHEQLSKTIANLDADGRLSELIDICNSLKSQLNSEPYLLAAQALERWGASIDPLDSALTLEERIEEFWKLINKDASARSFLYGGALYKEAEFNSSNGGISRQLSLKELRRGLNDSSEMTRRTAARLAGKQRIAEPELVAQLLDGSVSGSLLTRDAYAEAAEACWGTGAIAWWMQSLFRGSDSRRLIVARNLATHSPQDSLRGLIFVIAAADKSSGNKFTFDGRQIRIVKSSLNNSLISAQRLCDSHATAGMLLPWADDNMLDQGTTERMRVVEPKLADLCMKFAIHLLDLPTSSNREQVLEAWLSTR